MLVSFPTNVTGQYVVGDTIAFAVGASGYKSADWDLKFVIGSTPPTSFAATPDGDGWEINAAPANTSEIQPGVHAVALVLTHKTTGARQTYATRRISFLPDPTRSFPTSWAQRTLDKIETAIEKLSGSTNQQVIINGESYTKKDIARLMEVRRELRVEVDNERQSLGRGRSRRIVSRFV